MFGGKTTVEMNRFDFSKLFGRFHNGSGPPENPVFQLVDIPVVFHVLPNQHNGGMGSPSMTQKQRDFMINKTNQLYNIYDKETKMSVQFATFVSDETIVHDDFVSFVDCGYINQVDLRSMVVKAQDWEYKFHTFICESNQFSGQAAFPRDYAVTDPLHNALLIDYRAVACYDEDGSFLCEPTNGKQVSHTRWWRSRSAVLAHEIGSFRLATDAGSVEVS
jgi:hypothetical protein